MNDDETIGPMGARLEIELDEEAKGTLADWVNEVGLPALREIADDPDFDALFMVALRKDADGTRALCYTHASADDAAIVIDATLNNMGKIVRDAEARQTAEDANAIVSRAARRRRRRP